MAKAGPSIVVFDLGGVLIDWDPRHLYRKLFASDDAAMEHFLSTVCTHEWNRCQDAGSFGFCAGERMPAERTTMRQVREVLRLTTAGVGLNAKPSGKVPDTHSVGSICDHDLGVFTVTNIATENTDAVPPAHLVPRTPKAANQGLHKCRGPSVPLTCLAPLAAWQSLCTGHVDASLEIPSHWPSRTGTAQAAVADTSVSPASERSPP